MLCCAYFLIVKGNREDLFRFSLSYNPLINYHSILDRVTEAKVPVVIFEPKSIYGDRIESWDILLTGVDVRVLSGKIAPNLLISNGVEPEVRVVSHGASVKVVLEQLKLLDVNFQLLVVTELYDRSVYSTWLFESKSPVVVIEEKNTMYGPLITDISMLICESKYKIPVYNNGYVCNVPANVEWEEQLMINSEKVRSLIVEALL